MSNGLARAKTHTRQWLWFPARLPRGYWQSTWSTCPIMAQRRAPACALLLFWGSVLPRGAVSCRARGARV